MPPTPAETEAQALRVGLVVVHGQILRAAERIEALTRTLAQVEADATREEALSRDADEMLARLDWQATELRKAQEGHEARLEAK
jgi:chromosome segregation protein